MTPRLRPCDDPACRVCRWNDEEHHDSGHPVDESRKSLLLGAAAIVAWFLVFVIVLPTVAS